MAVYLDVEQRVAGDARVARRRPRFLGRDSHVAYAFIAPASFLLVVLVAYPFVLSVWFSLSDARVGNAGSFVALTRPSSQGRKPNVRTPPIRELTAVSRLLSPISDVMLRRMRRRRVCLRSIPHLQLLRGLLAAGNQTRSC